MLEVNATELTIPTYVRGPDDPLPPLTFGGAAPSPGRKPYPYTMQDDVDLASMELIKHYPVPVDGRPHSLGNMALAPNGDLYVGVRIKPHKQLLRKGADIIFEVDISFPQAALGDEIEVPILRGTEKLKIPSGTQNGDILRLRGKGVPGRYGRGDQLVHVTVNVPKKLSRKQKQLIEQLDEELGKKKGLFG